MKARTGIVVFGGDLALRRQDLDRIDQEASNLLQLRVYDLATGPGPDIGQDCRQRYRPTRLNRIQYVTFGEFAAGAGRRHAADFSAGTAIAIVAIASIAAGIAIAVVLATAVAARAGVFLTIAIILALTLALALTLGIALPLRPRQVWGSQRDQKCEYEGKPAVHDAFGYRRFKLTKR